MIDKKRLHAISAATLVALLIIFFIPFETAGRIIAAVLMVAIALTAYVLIKKRRIPSINKHQVLWIVSVITVVYLMLYYLLGLKFGFVRNFYAFNTKYVLSRALPIAAIIFFSEVYRHVMRAQEDKAADVLAYFVCVLAEMIGCATASVAVSSFDHFMDLVAATMLPAIVANLLYHYLTARYGYAPNVIYRAVTSLYLYLIPIVPAMADSLRCFISMIVPAGIYVFIDAMYEKKRRYALAKKSKLTVPITVLAMAIMLSTVMLISNQFRYGLLVIVTDSMTGELNRGDAAIYEQYDDQIIEEGQVIVFKRNNSLIVHRVDDIEIVNGRKRYYTKGDANDGQDADFRYDSDIVGIVNHKIPYIGFPTLLLRGMFTR